MTTPAPVVRAQAFLSDARNADFGWPYVPGARSAPEPTCYAAMATDAAEQTIDWLAVESGEPQRAARWTDALLLLAFARIDCRPDRRAQLCSALTKSVPLYTQPNEPEREGADSRGWSWIEGTYGWVEPTSYALLALKAARCPRGPRIAEAEKMLLSRTCADGGWNYGATKILGTQVASTPPPTALAAAALQDVPAAAKAVERALGYLENQVERRPSALSLSLAILSLNANRRPASRLAAALLARQHPDGSWRHQVDLTALAVLALRAEAEGRNVFRLE